MISPSQVEVWIRGIAAGMLHLHIENVVHRDLAARNVLLNISYQPKISDFGMSRILASDTVATTQSSVGPLKVLNYFVGLI